MKCAVLLLISFVLLLLLFQSSVEGFVVAPPPTSQRRRSKVQIIRTTNENYENPNAAHDILAQNNSSSVSSFISNNRQNRADVVFDKKYLSQWLQKAKVLVATAFLLFSLFFGSVSSADAAESGGRIGGSFSAPSKSYSSSPSRSYGSRTRYMSPSRSNYYNSPRPSVIVNPMTPMYSPWSPWGGFGFFGGPSIVARPWNPFSLVFDLVFWGLFISILASIFTKNATSSILGASRSTNSALGSGVSVVKLSVGMNVPQRKSSRSVLNYLNKLARTAQTDSRVGLQNLVSEVALELLRQRASIFAASSSSQHFADPDKAKRAYNNLAIIERGKFERETINKYKGVDYSSSQLQQQSYSHLPADATLAVVTLVLEIQGDSTKLDPIRSSGNVNDALARIASDVKVDDCLLSAEVLWTPQENTDVLTRRQVFEDYPELQTI